MAIIQSIRSRFGLLLAIIVGVALFAFILGDFITSGGFIVQRTKMSVAVINGTRIGYQEYQKNMAYTEQIMKLQYQTNQLDQTMMNSIREQTWQDLIQKYLFEKEYKKLGLAISDAEFSDLIQGPNPHPMVMQMFADPETGTLNRLQLSEFLSRINEIPDEQKLIWVFYENAINKERLYTKYNNLMRKGLYANKLEILDMEKSRAASVDISYVLNPYSEVADSAVTVTEAEMKKYYKDYIERYYQEETRDIKYVAFDVIPSKKDYEEAETWINDILPEFREVEDVEQYINFTSPPYDPTNYKKDELPDSIGTFMFSAELGDVYGPYFEDNSYKLAKLAKIQYLPDSVRASHILLPANQNNANQMRMLADSLIDLATSGFDFAQLVRENSRDYTTVINDGDLGWFKEGFKGPFFSDSCFYSNTGDVKLTYSDQGFHVVKITGRSTPVKKVQVGVLTREVTPSAETDHIYYTKAVEFAGSCSSLEDFEKEVADNDLMAIPVRGLKPLDPGVQGIENSRNIVHWAFQTEVEGEMMEEIDDYNGKYVVVILTGCRIKGHAPFEAVSDEIKSELIIQKKADRISEELKAVIADAQSIDDVAEATGKVVSSATGIRFASNSVGNIAGEPELVAAAVNAPDEGIAGPIRGQNGVYVFTVDNRPETAPSTNMAFTKSMIERDYARRANQSGYTSLRDVAKIEDYRYKFY